MFDPRTTRIDATEQIAILIHAQEKTARLQDIIEQLLTELRQMGTIADYRVDLERLNRLIRIANELGACREIISEVERRLLLADR